MKAAAAAHGHKHHMCCGECSATDLLVKMSTRGLTRAPCADAVIFSRCLISL